MSESVITDGAVFFGGDGALYVGLLVPSREAGAGVVNITACVVSKLNSVVGGAEVVMV